jgi:hypothetical protein
MNAFSESIGGWVSKLSAELLGATPLEMEEKYQ